MSLKFSQGTYKVQNPEKYIGLGAPRFRSSWEYTFMAFCDNNPSIHQWSSESVKIPYKDPLTGRGTVYVPDFLITYRNKSNQLIAELVEIKPKKQSVIESKMTAREGAVVAVNYAKWDAATKWARRNGLTFRVITEDDMFRNGRK
jgi:hypothetical protein